MTFNWRAFKSHQKQIKAVCAYCFASNLSLLILRIKQQGETNEINISDFDIFWCRCPS